MQANRVNIAGSPGLGDSDSFPHAPLAVNMEMTTLSHSFSVSVAPVNQTICYNLYTYGLLLLRPPVGHAMTHLGRRHVRLGVSGTTPRSVKWYTAFRPGQVADGIPGFLSRQRTYVSCIVVSPTSPRARCAACEFNLVGQLRVNVKRHNWTRRAALAPMSSSAIQCEIVPSSLDPLHAGGQHRTITLFGELRWIRTTVTGVWERGSLMRKWAMNVARCACMLASTELEIEVSM